MKKISWFEIYVDNMDRAKAFYEAVFETTLEKLPTPAPDVDMWQFPNDMDSYGAGGALAKMEGFPPGKSGTLVYFSSEDCTTEESKVEENGGAIIKKKESIGEYGFISIVKDTEGNIIGLHSMK